MVLPAASLIWTSLPDPDLELRLHPSGKANVKAPPSIVEPDTGTVATGSVALTVGVGVGFGVGLGDEAVGVAGAIGVTGGRGLGWLMTRSARRRTNPLPAMISEITPATAHAIVVRLPAGRCRVGWCGDHPETGGAGQ